MADVKRQFDSKTLARAKAITQTDAILSIGWNSGEEQLIGVVDGTAYEPYFVSIYIDQGWFETDCSCPVGIDCKHAAACLIYASRLTTSASHTKSHPNSAVVQQIQDRDELEIWMDQLIAAAESDPAMRQPSAVNGYEEGLLYTLELHLNEVNRCTGIDLQMHSAKRLKSGALKRGRMYKISLYGNSYSANTTRADDALVDLVRIMVLGAGASRTLELPPPYELSGTLGATILQSLVLNGCTYLGGQLDTPLTHGKPRELSISWEHSANSTDLLLKPRVQSSSDSEDTSTWHIIPTHPPWYIDYNAHQAGQLITDIAPNLLPLLLDAPTVPADSALTLANELSLALPNKTVPLPAEPTVTTLVDSLEPCVQVRSIDDSPDINNWVVACSMKYGDHYLSFDPQELESRTHVVDEHEKPVVIVREYEHEYQYYQRFRTILPQFEPCHARDPNRFGLADYQPVLRDPANRLAAFEQLFSVIDQLRQTGFSVDVRKPVGVEVEAVERLSASLHSSDAGWFELGLVLEHKGHRYQLMPLVINWLERTGGHSPLRWQGKDGSWLEAPEQMLKPVMDTLQELLDDSQSGSTLKVPRARALSLSHLRDELTESDIDNEWQDDDQLFELAERLRAFENLEVSSLSNAKPPKNLNAELRPYQSLGMGWLNFLAGAQLNGILADDMGLGKTVQTLAHLQSLVDLTAKRHKKNRNGPFLIVAPTSLLGNWKREAERFTPNLPVRIWHGSDRHEHPLADETAVIVVTSYALALRDHEQLDQHGFTLVVLDEAQTIKNPGAKITQSLKSLSIERRLCLTGTPLENHLGELWSLFDFLMPGMLGTQKRFTQHFRTPIEKHGNNYRQQRLNAVVQPFMLRRRKEQVAAELPEKTEIIREVVLGGAQAQLYESIRLAMQARVKKLLKQRGLARSHIEMLDALLKLRQTCCHPQLVKVPAARRVKESAKTLHALEMIEELIEEGRKILLFSQFTEMLGLLEVALKERNIAFVKLTGRTRKRDVVIDAFQHGEVPLFLISLKAGGTGLNLTAADTVIHYDPWWNPAVERQATDRTHRIGQDKPVFVYKLVAKDTVEEKIVAMQARKQALADATVERDNAQTVSSLSAEDMLSLFAAD